MRQFNLFKNSSADNQKTQKYSTTIEVPVYEPKNKKPHILELYDKSKTQLLISNIEESSVSDDEKAFLIESAKRHIVFNYEKIADYYSHSSKEVQELMEQSALVIIDFEKAIGYGYVKLCKEVREQYLQEYPDEE